MLTFDEMLAQVTDLVQQQGRVSYRALKRRFDIEDGYLEDLKAELIDAKRLAIKENFPKTRILTTPYTRSVASGGKILRGQATRAEVDRPHFLALLAETYEKAGQAEKGLGVVNEALLMVDKNEDRYYEAELYRLKGELLCSEDAEACFLKALDISQRQHAKSLELRAVMSLARLWQQQGKTAEARQGAIRDLQLVHRRL